MSGVWKYNLHICIPTCIRNTVFTTSYRGHIRHMWTCEVILLVLSPGVTKTISQWKYAYFAWTTCLCYSCIQVCEPHKPLGKGSKHGQMTHKIRGLFWARSLIRVTISLCIVSIDAYLLLTITGLSIHFVITGKTIISYWSKMRWNGLNRTKVHLSNIQE